MVKPIAALLAQALKDAFGTEELSAEALAGMIEIPPDKKLGDYAFPCFRLSKALKKAPPMIAQALAQAWRGEDTASIACVGGYVNFFLNRARFARQTVDRVLNASGAYGATAQGKGQTICIDYSSINIAKRFLISHLSSTMLGHSLRRIYEHLGYTVVGINHLGDWGTQFGKMIAAYKRWGAREDVEKGGLDVITALYVRFHEEAEKDPALDNEGRAWFKKIEEGDAEALSIFEWFKDLTLKDTERVYNLLGVSFDSYAGESFYNDKMDRVVRELREKGLLIESDGAHIVDLEEEKMPPFLILKNDGTTLYATRDIAAALYRKDTYDFFKCLYVVAYQQDLHFRQLFKVVEKMGYAWAKDLAHVSFGMVSYEGQALKTRKGHVLLLEDVLDRAMEKALAIIEEKSPGLDHKQDVARQVGIGAVIYATLSNNRIKDIDFWWDRVLNFDGETGPYVQYTHARCCSLLRKAEEAGMLPDEAYNADALTNDEAQEVLLALSRFPQIIQEAAAKYEPSMITRHVTLLAQAFNKYYYEHRILDGAPEEAAARVRLTRAVQDTLRTGLALIGLEAPERM